MGRAGRGLLSTVTVPRGRVLIPRVLSSLLRNGQSSFSSIRWKAHSSGRTWPSRICPCHPLLPPTSHQHSSSRHPKTASVPLQTCAGTKPSAISAYALGSPPHLGLGSFPSSVPRGAPHRPTSKVRAGVDLERLVKASVASGAFPGGCEHACGCMCRGLGRT